MKSIKKSVLFPALLILTAILVIFCINLQQVQNSIGTFYNYLIDRFGWFFILSSLVMLLFSLYIAFGPYKDIKIGGPDAKPAFGKISWAAMMFTTSCGAWLIVYGFLEPIYCAMDPAFQMESLSIEALEIGQTYAHFHWGPSAWCIYLPASVALSYLIYNRNKKNSSISDVCLLPFENAKSTKVKKVLSTVIEIIAVIAAIVSPVISIGTGMPLLTSLVQNLFSIPDSMIVYVQIVILFIWVFIFGVSVFLGLKKGIKNLSNINVTLALVLMVIVSLFTGFKFIFSAEISTLGQLFQLYPRLATYTDAFGDGAFVRGWTSSYWAVYFVYMPLMAVFNAKISKGRTLKEMVFGQLILCSLGCWFAMATFGNYSMKLVMSGTVPVAEILANEGEAAAIMAIINEMPFAKIIMAFLLIVCFIFLATTMDSSAFAAAEITFKRQNKDELAPRALRLTWAIVATVISFVLLQIKGFEVIRSLCYLAGFPLAILSYFIIVGTYKMLKKDHKKVPQIESVEQVEN